MANGNYALHQIPASSVSSVSCWICSAQRHLLTFVLSDLLLSVFIYPLPVLPFDFSLGLMKIFSATDPTAIFILCLLFSAFIPIKQGGKG